jgi:hypothetical protein
MGNFGAFFEKKIIENQRLIKIALFFRGMGNFQGEHARLG